MEKRVLLLISILCLFLPAHAHAEQCQNGKAAHERNGWEFIENNAFRTADAYAVRSNMPQATPVLGTAKVYYQFGGEFEGVYLLQILHEGSGTTLMMLKPNFDYCGDIESLDDTRADLFEVVVAKYNGIEF